MKRKVIIYLATFLIFIIIVPVVNLLSSPTVRTDEWRKKGYLYNIDFIAKYISGFLYSFGISTDSNQVVIGRDGWLYLGDLYEQTRTVDRHAPTNVDIAISEQIGETMHALDAYLASKGVKLFKIMIGPNKGTIYSEHLPHWGKPVSPTVTDILLTGLGARHYVDLKEALLAAKAASSEPLYYRTDTHWNYLGAGLAFRHFAQQISSSAPELIWPPDATYKLMGVEARGGGDLAKFLHLEENLSDSMPIIAALTLPIETSHYDFDTNQLIREGGNPPVGSPKQPLLVRSKNALNKKKILWLRDSFGTAMSPLMAATFSDVVQLHWEEAFKSAGRFAQLVDAWEPDYVFITVVERSSRNPLFVNFTPPFLLAKEQNFEKIQTATPVALNHLSFDHSKSEYRVEGIDPFIDFYFPELISVTNAPLLRIDISCDGGARHVPLQLFWLEDGRTFFDEEHSIKFSVQTCGSIIDIRSIPGLGSASIKRLRVDIDTQQICQRFQMENLMLGRNETN